ncbi:hypothetical protein BST61_g3082 [Cercospora zeina]
MSQQATIEDAATSELLFIHRYSIVKYQATTQSSSRQVLHRITSNPPSKPPIKSKFQHLSAKKGKNKHSALPPSTATPVVSANIPYQEVQPQPNTPTTTTTKLQTERKRKMPSLLPTLQTFFLGIQPSTASQQQQPSSSLTANYIIFHFIFAYAGISTRPWKHHHNLDHQVSPREDLTKYGPKAVTSGKLTQKQLDRIIRVQSAHENSVEHFPLFVGALIFAHVAGLPMETINRTGAYYTLARLVYVASYVWITDARLALLRGVAWWASNIVCLRLVWWGGKALNASRAV